MAGFLYEEVAWPHATLQFGGRLDHTRYAPEGGLPNRDFTEWSGSVGLLVRPAAANDNFVIAAQPGARGASARARGAVFLRPPPRQLRVSRSATPISSPNARSASTLALRARGARFEGEVSFFRNDIDNFIFRNPISDEEFAEREDEFDDRFNVEHGGEQDDPHGGDLPYVEFVGRDATLWGFEAHGDVKLNRWTAEFTFDMVRGTLSDTDRDLPRMPPYRGIVGLRYAQRRLPGGHAR